MLSWQEEQAERRRILREDQPTTMHQFALEETIPRGRYDEVGKPNILAQSADIAAKYPAASAAHQTTLPPEPPLGYSVERDHVGPVELPPQDHDPASEAPTMPFLLSSLTLDLPFRPLAWKSAKQLPTLRCLSKTLLRPLPPMTLSTQGWAFLNQATI
jgi:hypothetical protein